MDRPRRMQTVRGDYNTFCCGEQINHGGIILAAQASWTLPGLIVALDRLLSETEAEERASRVRRLNDWRPGL